MGFNRIINQELVKAVLVSTLFLSVLFLLSSCDSDTQVVEYDLNEKIDISNISDSHSHQSGKDVITFGFDLRASPQEDARQYLPFLEYLQRETGYKFKLHFTPKNDNIADSVGSNHIQFAALGAVSYLKSRSKHGVIPVVRGINNEGKAEYQSFFVVRPNSKIKSLSDIQGKRLAFGSRSSTQGHLIPRIVLSKKGIKLSSFASYKYTGSHQNCASSVISNKADVCAMQDTMAKDMEKKKLLRILHKSSYYPSSGIVANKDLPDKVLQKVKLALLNFEPQGKDKAGLYHWSRTEMPRGFTAADVGDYHELQEWSARLGFLEENDSSGK